jgi:hypothetical protein
MMTSSIPIASSSRSMISEEMGLRHTQPKDAFWFYSIALIEGVWERSDEERNETWLCMRKRARMPFMVTLILDLTFI